MKASNAVTGCDTGTPEGARQIDEGRRSALKVLGAGAGAVAASTLGGSLSRSAHAAPGKKAPILMDGHVHVTTRAYWEGIDVWQPQATGWDFARARAAGVNMIIENLSTYGYWNYNYTPKHTLRLIENFLEIAEANQDKMGLALTVADARSIAASGRMAVFLSIESGWDHEGDIDVLRAFYRLGLRGTQFATQTEFNDLADDGGNPHWGGLSPNGREVIAEMNRLGMMIDITHASALSQAQIIEASNGPVVASHVWPAGVSAGGLSDAVIVALAAKGGVMGIHGASGSIGNRYKAWAAANPATAAALGAPVRNLVGYRPSFTHNADIDNWGAYIARFDAETRANWLAVFKPFVDDPVAATLVPTADEWAEHVNYVIKLVGPDHVGIGLDMFGGRTGVPSDPTGYPQLVAALNRITTPENVTKITGENWMRVLGQIFGESGCRPGPGNSGNAPGHCK